jgi:hypothetical protein
MAEQAEFRGDRSPVLGGGLVVLAGVFFALPLLMTEESFLNTRARRGGFLKIIEQTIGWELFSLLMITFGVWVLAMGVAVLWKALNDTPDVTALEDRLEFHPAVRRAPASYDEVDYWRIEFESGNPVLRMHFFESHWSVQGIVRRKTVKLEGSTEDLEPLVGYFARHPVMSGKFVR